MKRSIKMLVFLFVLAILGGCGSDRAQEESAVADMVTEESNRESQEDYETLEETENNLEENPETVNGTINENAETASQLDESEQVINELTNINVSKTFQIDENELELSYIGQNGESKFLLTASAADYEHGSLILVYFFDVFMEIPGTYSITVTVGDASVSILPVDGEYQRKGTNADGSVAEGMPDWIIMSRADFELSDEAVDKFYEDMGEVKNEFAMALAEAIGYEIEAVQEQPQ